MITIEEDIESSDWIKRAWDLPPYKSEEFMALFGHDLDHFRTLPVYKYAVEQGRIVNDEWVQTSAKEDRMNPELRSYLRLAAPNMSTDVAWPLVNVCKSIDNLDDVPAEVWETIHHYLPEGVQMTAKAESAWNEAAHPREPKGSTVGGRFTSAPQGPPGPSTMDDFTKLPILERNPAFTALSREHRDALADARKSVPARMDELLGADRPFVNVESYVRSYADILPKDNQDAIIALMNDVHTDARAAGMSPEDAHNLQHAMSRMVIAQDYEAASRTLGDHGSFHLKGDADMAKEILGVLPTNVNTPGNRLMMSVVAAAHDMGYLTPPARNFLDADHPRWSQQYFDTHMRPELARTMGEDWASMASNLIATHDATTVDWESKPEQSAMSTADNFALFHKEKMPPMLRHVPGNIDVLVRLGEGKVDLVSAKELMRANIDRADHLTPKLKAAYSHALAEVTGVLPKFTLGMVGSQYKGVSWNKEAKAVEVSMERGKANEGLAKVLDLGQRQYKKLAETYGSTPDELVNTGLTKFVDKMGRVILIAKLRTRKGDFFLIIKRNLFG